MSISNFLKEKIEIKEEKNTIDLSKFRKPVKIVENRNKPCPVCSKNRFIVVYKRKSNKILAYRCEYCGHPIFVKEKVKQTIKEEKVIKSDVEFECPVGEVKKCVFEACSFYGNICKLRKNK